MIQCEVPALGGRNGLEFEQNPEKRVLKTCPLMSFTWLPILTAETRDSFKMFYFSDYEKSSEYNKKTSLRAELNLYKIVSLLIKLGFFKVWQLFIV